MTTASGQKGLHHGEDGVSPIRSGGRASTEARRIRARSALALASLVILGACNRQLDGWDSDVAPAGPRAVTAKAGSGGEQGLQEVDRPPAAKANVKLGSGQVVQARPAPGSTATFSA